MTTPMREVRRALIACVIALAACSVHAKKPDKEGRMLEQGLSLLQKKDAQSICEGAKILGRIARTEAIEPLFMHLRARDEAVRECVRESLARHDVAPVLLAQWRSEDGELKERALELAVALPHPGLMAIWQEAAVDPEARRRKRAATGLRRQAEGPEVWALLEKLVGDAEHEVRWWAIDTLGLSKSDEARRILKARLEVEPDEGLRTFITRALGG